MHFISQPQNARSGWRAHWPVWKWHLKLYARWCSKARHRCSLDSYLLFNACTLIKAPLTTGVNNISPLRFSPEKVSTPFTLQVVVCFCQCVCVHTLHLITDIQKLRYVHVCSIFLISLHKARSFQAHFKECSCFSIIQHMFALTSAMYFTDIESKKVF